MATFLIYAHTDPVMLARLTRRLAPHRVIVHIDAKSDEAPFRECVSRDVEFTRERVPVFWADYSQVRAMRVLIEHAAAGDPEEHLVMLSGQCYPARPIHELESHLDAHAGFQFIRSFHVFDSNANYVAQVERTHLLDIPTALPQPIRGATRRLVAAASRMKTREAPPGLTVCHGQTHWALTRACALDALARLSPEIERYFRRSFSPDEKVFHSLVASGPFGAKIFGGSPVEFVGAGNYRYTNFHYIDPTLRELDHRDLEAILRSDQYFARKITTRRGGALMDALDARRVGA